MKYTNKVAYIVPIVPIILFLLIQPVSAQTKSIKERLVKCENESTVYLVQNNKTAKVFTDEQTFYSYGYEFAQIESLNCQKALPFKQSGTVPNKFGNGFRLLKKVGDPAVFACEYKRSYFVCDKILNGQDAQMRFGNNWSQQIFETEAQTMDMLVWHWKNDAIK